MTQHVKREFKRIGDTRALAYEVKLDSLPSDFAAKHPYMYQAAFGSDVPVDMKMDWNSFASVLSTMPCRGKRGASDSVDVGSFNQAAAGFMQQMQQMQQMQFYTYQALTGSAKGDPKVPIALQSISPNAVSSSSSDQLHIQDLRPGQLQVFPTPVLQQQQQLQQQHAEPQLQQQQQQQQQHEQQQQLEKGPEKEKQQQQQQQPTNATELPTTMGGKRARLSVGDSISLIAAKLNERDSLKPKAKAKTKAKAKAAATTKASTTSSAWRPFFDIVESRQHVQCRTGLKGPGQYRTISFSTAGSRAKAIELAKKWVNEQVKKGPP